MFKKTTRFNALVLVAMIGLSAQLSRAVVTACGSTNAVNLGATNPGGINGTSAALNNPAQGCGATDLGFNSFVVTPTVGGSNIAGPAAGAIDPTTTGGAITGGDAIGNISLDFTGAFTTGAHSGAHTLDESISYLATPNLGGPAEEPTTPAGDHWALTGVTALLVVGDTITGGPAIPVGNGTATGDVYMQVTETVCLGQNLLTGCVATGATANEATLTYTITYTGNGTTLTLATATASSCTAGATTNFGCAASAGGITFNPLLSAVVSDAIFLNHPIDAPGNQYTIGFTSFDDPFSQTEESPEPSTFILLGSTLVGLLALRLQRRKQA